MGRRPRFWAIMIHRQQIIIIWSNLTNVIPLFNRLFTMSLQELVNQTGTDELIAEFVALASLTHSDLFSAANLIYHHMIAMILTPAITNC